MRPRNLFSKFRLPTKETAPSVSVRPHDVDAALTHVQNFFPPPMWISASMLVGLGVHSTSHFVRVNFRA